MNDTFPRSEIEQRLLLLTPQTSEEEGNILTDSSGRYLSLLLVHCYKSEDKGGCV